MIQAPIDVFISWTSADRDVKNVLTDKFQQLGLSCWESDEYCISDFSDECIDAVRRSQVFIVIVSDSSMARGYVKNEILVAREQEDKGLLNILVYKVTDKPYTNSFQGYLNHISFVPGNTFCRSNPYAGGSSIDKLVNRTVRLLELRSKGTPTDYRCLLNPRVEGLEIHGTSYYVPHSRDRELDALEEAFSHSRVVILKGLFGSGRQTLVRQYVQRHRKELNHAVIVRQSQESLEDFFLSGLQFANVDQVFDDLEGEALLKRKFQILQYLRPDSLLVISDAQLHNGIGDTLRQLLLGLQCRVILLTQHDPGSDRDWIPVIPVESMAASHLTELFFHHYPHAAEDEQLSLAPVLQTFFQRIGGHPLTIVLTAGALARETDAFPDRIAGFLLAEHRSGLVLQDQILEHISRVLEREQFTEQEETILLATALLAAPAVSQARLKAVLTQCGVEDWAAVTGLSLRHWLRIDVRNRCVTMEPMIARLMLHKFPENYRVMTFCLLALEINTISYKILATHKTLTDSFGAAEHFFRNVRLSEIAELFRLLVLVSSNPSQQVRDALRQALDRYQHAYGAYITDYESGFTTPADDSDYEDYDHWEVGDDLPEAPAEVFAPVSDAPEYHREQFLREVISYVHPFLVPVSKLYVSRLGDFAMDLSAGNPLLTPANSENLSMTWVMDTIGLDAEETTALLEAVHSLSRKDFLDLMDHQDEELLDYLILLESANAYQCFFRRDYGAMLLSMDNILDYLIRYPDPEDEDGDTDFAMLPFVLLASAYLHSGGYHHAQLLCQKILPLVGNRPFRSYLLIIYIRAMQRAGQYHEVLFDAFEQYLNTFDANYAEVYSTLAEQQAAKKEHMLDYAQSLCRGGQLNNAVKQFEKAQSLGRDHLPEETLRTAGVIVEVMSEEDFQEAVSFLKRHFTMAQLSQLEKSQDPDISHMAWEFRCYLDSSLACPTDFQQGADPLKYQDYYQEYSRENNGIWQKRYQEIAHHAMYIDFSQHSDEALAAAAQALRNKAKTKKLLDLAPEAFALAGEAGFRVLGYRPHYVQFLGAAAMADGRIAEIFNGEGKTYAIALTAILQSLFGRKVFVVDSSQYLSRRNHTWMQGVYKLLGLECGLIEQQADILQWKHIAQPPVIYAHLRSLVFGVLCCELESDFRCDQLSLDCAILDEADCILVDQAATPYLTARLEKDSGAAVRCRSVLCLANRIAGNPDFYTCQDHDLTLTSAAMEEISRFFRVSYDKITDLGEIRLIEQQLKTALQCFHYEDGVDFYIHQGKPVYEDNETGLFTPVETYHPDRAFYLCAFHNLSTASAEDALGRISVSTNQISLRDFFQRFQVLCGTTATAVSFRKEFKDIYGLKYFAVPSHFPCIRKNYESPIYFSTWRKDMDILNTVVERHAKKQPILLITQSVAESIKYSHYLRKQQIPHQLLNACNSEDSPELLSTAGIPGSVLIATTLANRGVDIKLGGDPELMTRRDLVLAGEDITGLDALIYTRPDQTQRENPLYLKFANLLEKNRLQAAALRQEALAAGGLCVIATSFFPEPRTEQQARGRCGRQGEPGESWVFRSLEDPKLADIVTKSMKNLIVSNELEDQSVDMWILRQSIRTHQQRLHNSRFQDIRSNNNRCAALESARTWFIGSKDDLLSGKLTPRDFLSKWFLLPETLEDIARLQKGEASGPLFLVQLYRTHRPQLASRKGVRAADALLDAFWFSLLEKEGFSEDVVQKLLTHLLPRFWQSYVSEVQKLDRISNLPEADRNAELAKLRYQLLTQCVEKLHLARLRPSRRPPRRIRGE